MVLTRGNPERRRRALRLPNNKTRGLLRQPFFFTI
nr:MAG TPA: hypothetical protein [Caudoviricetes sp.]